MKLFRIIGLLLMLASLRAGAQSTFKIGFLGGVATSQVHGDNFSGFNKAGLAVGGFAKMGLKNDWDLKFEILYVQKGSRDLAHPDKGDYISYQLKLNYAEVPLIIRKNFKKISLELGASEGFLVHYEEYDANGRIPDPKPFARTETNLVTGLAYRLKDNIDLNVRYTNSLMPVRRFDIPAYYASRFYNLFNQGLYNNVLTFTLHYQLGGKDEQQ